MALKLQRSIRTEKPELEEDSNLDTNSENIVVARTLSSLDFQALNLRPRH